MFSTKGMSSYTMSFSANLREVSLNLTCSALQWQKEKQIKAQFFFHWIIQLYYLVYTVKL